MATRGKITDLFDLDSIIGQQRAVVNLVDAFIEKTEKVKPVKIQLEGSEKTKDALKGISELALNLKEYQKINDQLAVSQAKLNALQNDNSKVLQANRLELQEKNRATKEEIQLEKAAEGSIKQKQIQLKQLQRTYDELSEVQRNAAEGQELLKSIQALDAELKELEGSTGRFQRNVGNYSGAIKILDKALIDVRNKLDDFNKSGSANADIIEQLRKEEQLLEKLLTNQVTGFASSTAEIKENTKALQQLEAQGLGSTEAYRELFKATAELKDETDDLKASLKNAAPDDVAFNAAADAARGLIGVYGLAKSTAAAFGIENEALEETLVKLQAAETALQSIEAIRAVFKKENAVRQAINIGLQKIEILQTNIQTAAESKNIVVRYAAIAAQKALNLVMAANPALLVVGAIALLATTLVSFRSATDSAVKSFEDLNNEFEANSRLASNSADAIKRAGDKIIAELELRGVTEQKIREKRLQFDEQSLKKTEEFLDRERINYDRAMSERRMAVAGEIDLNSDQLDERKKFIDNYEKVSESYYDGLNKLEIDRLRFLKANKDDEKKAQDDRIKKAKEAADKLAEFNSRESKALFEIQKLRIQDQIKTQEALASNENSFSIQRLKAQEEAASLRFQLLEKQREFELSNEKLTSSERLLIQQQFASAVLQLEKDNAKAVADILRQSGEQQKAAELERITKRLEALQKSYDSEVSFIDKSENERKKRQAEALSAGIISQEQYEANILRIEADSQKERLLQQIEYYKNVADTANLSDEERKKALLELSQAELALAQIGLDKKKEFLDKEKQLLQELKNAYTDLGKQIAASFTEIVSGVFDRQKNEIQQQINQLEERKQKEIENANASIQNEQDRAAAITTINARAQAQREALERRQKQLDIQKARFEKVAAILSIGIDTIQKTAALKAQAAILLANPATAALAPLALSQIPVVIASGAIAAATIAAKPVPQFEDGTMDAPGGIALVGEKRKELVVEPSGKAYLTPDRPTFMDIPKHSVIYPDADQILRDVEQVALAEMARSMPGIVHEKDYTEFMIKALSEKLDRVVHAIEDKPTPIINNDHNGWNMSWVNGKRHTQYIHENTQF